MAGTNSNQDPSSKQQNKRGKQKKTPEEKKFVEQKPEEQKSLSNNKDDLLEREMKEIPNDNSSWLEAFKFSVTHSLKDIFRHKFTYCLAFTSVFIVVLSSLVINTIIQKGPLVFLSLAEQAKGEIDAYLLPYGRHKQGNEFKDLYLNMTKVDQLLGRDQYLFSPRKFINFGSVVLDGASQLYDPDNKESVSQYHQQFNQELGLPSRDQVYRANFERGVFTQVIGMDTLRERENEVGRNYTYPPIEFGQCFASQKNKPSNYDEKSASQFAILKLPLNQFITQLATDYNRRNPDKNAVALNLTKLDVIMPCKISYVVDKGKIGSNHEHHIWMEYDKILELISHYLPSFLDNENEFISYLRETKDLMQSYADALVISLPKPRTKFFSNSNIEQIRAQVSEYFRQIEEKLGFYPIKITESLIDDVAAFSRYVMFIGIIFDLVVALLVIISVLLIYSLLVINIETKTFDIGVQRMVGLTKGGLILMVLVQSVLFVVPALASAFIVAIPSLIAFQHILKGQLGLESDIMPSKSAVFQALFLGIVIPILSVIMPIQIALSKSLNDTLDTQRSKNQAAYTQVLQVKDRDANQFLSFGIFAVLYGTILYYVLPLSLLSFNLGMIMNIFLFILFGIIFGLSIMALKQQRTIETAFTHLFLFFEKKAMRTMVIKNLVANRDRNKMTAILYSLGLGFIIFLNVAQNTQVQTLRLHEAKKHVGYFQLIINDPTSQWSIKPKHVEPILRQHYDLIDDHGWVTNNIMKVPELRMTQQRAKDHSMTSDNFCALVGVTPSLHSSSHRQVEDITFQNMTTGLSLTEQLYTARGSQSAGQGQLIAEKVNVKGTSEATFLYYIVSPISTIKYQLRSLFQTAVFQGFVMNRLFLGGERWDSLLVSLPYYSHIAKTKISQLPYKLLSIKLKEPRNRDHMAILKKAIQNQLLDAGFTRKDFSFTDVIKDFENMDQVQLILQVIFAFVISITMFLCFFSLSASMSANLYQQSKEIGIMRAIGMSKSQVLRIFVYEAFILVISSAVQGIAIGLIIGWLITNQQATFVQIPLKFNIPTIESLQIAVFSIFCAFISTYGPTKRMLQKSIAEMWNIV